MARPSNDPEIIEMQKLKRMAPKDLHLSRYPFRTGIKYYKAKKNTKYTPTTMEENVRKLYMFAEIFENLKKIGAVRSTDPRCIDQYDVEAFLDYLRDSGLQMSTKIKYANILATYLSVFGNNTIDEMKRTADWPLIRDEKSEIFSLERDELQRIFDCIDTYEPKTEIREWRRIMISGVLSLMFGTACRPKEIVHARQKDLVLEEGKSSFYIEHPKGEGSWGVKEWIPIIRGDMAERVRLFMTERMQFLKAHDIADSQYLFFNYRTGQPYTQKAIREMKCEIEEASGVKFRLKDMRATYVTLTAENNVDRLKNVSVQLRHKSVNTTESYYLRLRRMKAQEKIADVWEETAIEDSKNK